MFQSHPSRVRELKLGSSFNLPDNVVAPLPGA